MKIVTTLLRGSLPYGLILLAALMFSTVSCTKTEVELADEFENSEVTLRGPGKALPPSDISIAGIAQAAGFTELLAALTYVDEELNAGLVTLFSEGTDQYTVFAPTNTAFSALYDNEALEQLLGTEVNGITDIPAPIVLDVLLYHVTEGRRAANSVVPKRNVRNIQTLLGVKFTVGPDAEITAVGNTATIVGPNNSASNGIVHIIDAVLLPIEIE